LGLQLSLRMMSTWLLIPQRLKVDTPEARSMSLRQHWGALSTPSTSMRSTPNSVALLGLQSSLRMMSTWLLSPQRLKVGTPEAWSMPQRQHWGLRSIDSRKLLDQASSVTALGLTIIVAHIVDLEAQSPTP
jgi:hypothetical protein